MILAFSASQVPLIFLYTTLVWGVPTLLVLKNFKSYKDRGIGIKLTAFFAFLSGWFSIQNGDFFYYTLMLAGGKVSEHLEPFYHWVWSVTRSYLLWRAIVWGLATIAFFWMINRIPVNKHFACFIFIISQLFYWGSMRNMLGFATLFLGISMFFYRLKKLSRLISIGLGAALVLLSLSFHRSMFIYAIAMVISFLPLNKMAFRVSIIAFPFIYASIFLFASVFLENLGNEEVSDLGNAYLKYSVSDETYFQSMNTLILILCYGYFFIRSFRYMDKYKVPFFFKVMLRYSYMIFYGGLLFYQQQDAGWLSLRFLTAGELGMSVCLMYYLYKMPLTNIVRVALGGILWMSVFNWMYMIYGWSNYVNNFVKFGKLILS